MKCLRYTGLYTAWFIVTFISPLSLEPLGGYTTKSVTRGHWPVSHHVQTVQPQTASLPCDFRVTKVIGCVTGNAAGSSTVMSEYITAESLPLKVEPRASSRDQCSSCISTHTDLYTGQQQRKTRSTCQTCIYVQFLFC